MTDERIYAYTFHDSQVKSPLVTELYVAATVSQADLSARKDLQNRLTRKCKATLTGSYRAEDVLSMMGIGNIKKSHYNLAAALKLVVSEYEMTETEEKAILKVAERIAKMSVEPPPESPPLDTQAQDVL